MAKKWNVASTSGNVFLFNPADIVIKADLNGRHDLPDITELKESIAKYGQLEPVAVRDEGGYPVLVMGFSRWRAIVELNNERPNEQMKIQAVYTRCNEVEGLLLNHEENRRRNQTTALDDAQLYQRLERYSWTPKEIADRLGVSPTHVKQRLALVEASIELQEAVRSKRIPANAAAKIAKMAVDVQRKAVAGNGHVSKEAVAAATNTTVKPSFKAVREYVQQFDGPGVEDETRDVVRRILAYMDGAA